MSRDQSYKDAMSKQATIRASQNSQIVEVKANTTLQSMLRDLVKVKPKEPLKSWMIACVVLLKQARALQSEV